MTTHDDRPVAIIGGGIAGLVAATELRARGHRVRLFEAAPELGGMARTVVDDEGFSYDYGAHFITNRLADELGASHLCRTVPRYGEDVVLGGRTYSYPYGLARRPDFVRAFVVQQLRRGGGVPRNARDLLAERYGAALTDQVALPLVEAWSGAAGDQLAPAIVDKLDEGIVKTLWLKAAGKVTRRAITIGYTRERPSSVKVHHVYPRGGLGSLIAYIAQQHRDIIETDSRVQSIDVVDERVVSVRVNDTDIPVKAAISTAPVHVLPKLINGSDRLDAYADFRYRPMIFVNLRFDGRGLLSNTVQWFPERRAPYFRLTEAPLSMPWLAPEGKTIITADIGASIGDEWWTMDDDALSTLCLEHLTATVPGAASRYLGSRVMRTPLAYPVFLNSYEDVRQRFANRLPIDGLVSVGRNGEFAHILMEDIYWRTRDRIAALDAQLSS